MESKNYIYIAKSIDGYIADKNGDIDWLNTVPNPENNDFGFGDFIEHIDAIVMGRKTFEKVIAFDVPWPYSKPVFVVSSSLTEVPSEYKDKAEIINGAPTAIIASLNKKGFEKLYVDGGTIIHEFLMEDLIDEMIIYTIPIVLGGGIALFNELPHSLVFDLIESEVFLNAITKNVYKRKR